MSKCLSKSIHGALPLRFLQVILIPPDGLRSFSSILKTRGIKKTLGGRVWPAAGITKIINEKLQFPLVSGFYDILCQLSLGLPSHCLNVELHWALTLTALCRSEVTRACLWHDTWSQTVNWYVKIWMQVNTFTTHIQPVLEPDDKLTAFVSVHMSVYLAHWWPFWSACKKSCDVCEDVQHIFPRNYMSINMSDICHHVCLRTCRRTCGVRDMSVDTSFYVLVHMPVQMQESHKVRWVLCVLLVQIRSFGGCQGLSLWGSFTTIVWRSFGQSTGLQNMHWSNSPGDSHFHPWEQPEDGSYRIGPPHQTKFRWKARGPLAAISFNVCDVTDKRHMRLWRAILVWPFGRIFAATLQIGFLL